MNSKINLKLAALLAALFLVAAVITANAQTCDLRNSASSANCVLIPASTFAGHISLIVANSSDPQMRGVDARRIVTIGAVMQNAQPVGDTSVVQNPRIPMSQYTLIVDTKSAVSKILSPSLPNPTLLKFFDKPPKSSNRIAVPFKATHGRTGATSASFQGRRINFESTPTLFASSRNTFSKSDFLVSGSAFHRTKLSRSSEAQSVRDFEYLRTLLTSENQRRLDSFSTRKTTESNILVVSPSATRKDFEDGVASFAGKRNQWYSGSGHFKSPKFDLVRGVEAKQRFGISLKTKPLYHASKPSNGKTSNNPNAFGRFEGVGQSCDLRNASSLGGCTDVFYGWFTGRTDVVSQRLVYGDGFSPVINATVRSYKRQNVGCGYSTRVTITQTYANGQTCSMTEGDNHNRPCSQCTTTGGLGTTVVSSANFRGSVSRNSLVSFFPDPGVTFTDQQAFAATIPLPTTLAGVTVSIDGTLLGLVSVAQGQINAYLPDWLPEGPTEVFASIATTRGSVPSFTGRPQLNPNAPGIFTAAANGTGQAASVWLVVKPNGQQNYYAPGQLQFSSGDIVVLIVYATGINESQCELILNNNTRFVAQYAGSSGFVGVVQANFIIPTNQLWQGVVSGYIRVGVPGRSWDSNSVDYRR